MPFPTLFPSKMDNTISFRNRILCILFLSLLFPFLSFSVADPQWGTVAFISIQEDYILHLGPICHLIFQFLGMQNDMLTSKLLHLLILCCQSAHEADGPDSLSGVSVPVYISSLDSAVSFKLVYCISYRIIHLTIWSHCSVSPLISEL